MALSSLIMSIRLTSIPNRHTLAQVDDNKLAQTDEESIIEGWGQPLPLGVNDRVICPSFIFPCPIHIDNPCENERKL